jgi:hypothetical protein
MKRHREAKQLARIEKDTLMTKIMERKRERLEKPTPRLEYSSLKTSLLPMLIGADEGSRTIKQKLHKILDSSQQMTEDFMKR